MVAHMAPRPIAHVSESPGSTVHRAPERQQLLTRDSVAIHAHNTHAAKFVADAVISTNYGRGIVQTLMQKRYVLFCFVHWVQQTARALDSVEVLEHTCEL